MKIAARDGFTFLEVLSTFSVISIIAAVAFSIAGDLAARAKNEKLRSDVATLNRAVAVYRANGGSLDAEETPDSVIGKLRSSAANANLLPGLSSSMVDSRVWFRIQSGEEAENSSPRAFWDNAAARFTITSAGGPGIKEFYLDDERGESASLTESRSNAFSYNAGDGWIWDYQDRSRPSSLNASPAPLANVTNNFVAVTGPAEPPSPSLRSLIGFSMSASLTTPPLGSPSGTFVTVNDGSWFSSTTWQGGFRPGRNLRGKNVVVKNRVTFPNGRGDLEIDSGTLTVLGTLFVDNQNIKLRHAAGTVNISGGLVIVDNANFENIEGRVNFSGGGLQICNGNYKEESPVGGTRGTGYIYTNNGNIENVGAGPFSTGIAWHAEGGAGVFLPTPENPGIAKPPGGCRDETHHENAVQGEQRIVYTYSFTNSGSDFIAVNFTDDLTDGLSWDTSYVPVESGNITAAGLQYGASDTVASIGSLMLPPGPSSFTLATRAIQPTTNDQDIVNEAAITSIPSASSPSETLFAKATALIAKIFSRP